MGKSNEVRVPNVYLLRFPDLRELLMNACVLLSDKNMSHNLLLMDSDSKEGGTFFMVIIHNCCSEGWSSGPWRAKMTPHSIFPFLQYCGDRQLRAGAWEKWTSKVRYGGTVDIH